jgi:hypothetical protein
MNRTIPIVSLAKPAYGDKCNGCGMCCVEEVCGLGLELGDRKICKALEANQDGTFSCGLVGNPYKYLSDERTRTWRMIDEISPGVGEDGLRSYHAHMLGAGKGCDSLDSDQ